MFISYVHISQTNKHTNSIIPSTSNEIQMTHCVQSLLTAPKIYVQGQATCLSKSSGTYTQTLIYYNSLITIQVSKRRTDRVKRLIYKVTNFVQSALFPRFD